MKPLIVIRRVPKIDFMRWHIAAFVFSGLLSVLTLVVVLTPGLNYGIDFLGGTLIEARVTTGPANLAEMRSKLDALNLGEVTLQEFGEPSDVLIRFAQQPGGDAAQMQAVQAVREALGPGIEYRRVEVVGPSVGSELIRAGMLATVLALLGDRRLCLVSLRVAVRHRRRWLRPCTTSRRRSACSRCCSSSSI